MKICLAFTITFFLCIACRAETTLHILNWEGYISPGLIGQWQKHSGTKLKQSYIDNDEQRDRIVAANTGAFDVVVVDGISSKTFGDHKLFATVNVENVPNLKNTGTQWTEYCGPGRAMPYLWGTIGILYRKDKFPGVPESWQDLIKPDEKLRKRIGMLEDSTDTLAPALLLAEKDPLTSNPEDLRVAFNLLKEQVPYVETYQYIISHEQTGPERQHLYMALGYSGDQRTLNEIAGEEIWDFVIPREGTLLWIDCMAVMANSEKQVLAFDFLNFLSDAKISAANAEELYVAPANNRAVLLLSESMRQDKTVFPTDSVMKKSVPYQHLNNENLMLRYRITSALLKLHETQ